MLLLWLIVLVAVIAALAGIDVGALIMAFIVFIIATLTGLAGVDRRRHHRKQYHIHSP